MADSKRKTGNNRIDQYLENVYGKAKQGSYDGAYYTLADWNKYIQSRPNPNTTIEKSDLENYITELSKRTETHTVYDYLGYLVRYFKYYRDMTTLAKCANDKKKDFKPQKLEEHLTYGNVKDLYKIAKPKMKVTIRLLLLKRDIDVQELENIIIKEPINPENYEFVMKSNDNRDEILIKLDPKTLEIAKQFITRQIKRNELRLLGAGRRTISGNIRRFGEKNKILLRPKDLQRFAEKRPLQEILEVLGDVTLNQ